MWSDRTAGAIEAKERRQDLEARGFCINGQGHGPPVPGLLRCRWCVAVHRKGVMVAVREARKDENAPQPPPKWRLTMRGTR